jgi:hypothetical protein
MADHHEEYLTYTQFRTLSTEIIRMEGLVGLSALRRLAIGTKTHDVWNDVVSADCCTLRLHLQGDLDMGLGFLVGVVFWILSQTLLVSMVS